MDASAFFPESHSFRCAVLWFAIIRLRCITPDTNICLSRVRFQSCRAAASSPAIVIILLDAFAARQGLMIGIRLVRI